MNDIVERLRRLPEFFEPSNRLGLEAADEIERMRDTIDGEADESASTIAHLNSEINWQKGRAEAAEAKLSKAVEALEAIKRGGFNGASTWLQGIARATLKEIGGDDA
jgi:hypothetical protein